jgi:hypothetical protein
MMIANRSSLLNPPPLLPVLLLLLLTLLLGLLPAAPAVLLLLAPPAAELLLLLQLKQQLHVRVELLQFPAAAAGGVRRCWSRARMITPAVCVTSAACVLLW